MKELAAQVKAEAPRASAAPYDVNFTASAEAVYVEMRKRAEAAEARGDGSNAHCTAFRMVDEAIRKIIPSDPTNPKYRLHAPLDGMYRISNGRMRIVWIVHDTRRALLVMYIFSEEMRKDGDVKDPYAILNAMAKAGYLKSIAEEWRKAMQPPNSQIH